MAIDLRVECYSGYKADQRPLRFTMGHRTLKVNLVMDQWHSPSATYFRILAEDGNTYILEHDEGQDCWSLEVFLSTGSRPRYN